MRDAVEAALSDITLLGTEEQVRLAAHAARELIAGRHLHTHELGVSLRNFIRQELDLQPIPNGWDIPLQGPTRPGGGGRRIKRARQREGQRRWWSGRRAQGESGGAMGLMGMGGMAGLGIGHGMEEEKSAPEIEPARGE